jgi:hypothetical protein
MAQDSCIKTAANGTRTLETTNKGVTVGVLNSDTALTSAGSGTIPAAGAGAGVAERHAGGDRGLEDLPLVRLGLGQ